MASVHALLPRRIATLSVHTSPLDQPGTGDAGGLNVYVVETAKRLAGLGVHTDIFTRATSTDLPSSVDIAPGVTVRHVPAGPFEGLPKEDLPGLLCSFTAEVLRAEARHEPGYYELVHSHYWLSGQIGTVAKERWGTPLVHSMHTTALVKNASLARGDTPEPSVRVHGERQVVGAADRLVANTEAEATQLVELYGAESDRVIVVPPGVDLQTFRPGDVAEARSSLGLDQAALVLLFVGRIQPLKGPDVLLRAAAELVDTQPQLRGRLVVAVVGGPSGSGLRQPEHLKQLAHDLGLDDVVRFAPPQGHDALAQWYRAADLTVVPSYNESFGLVAVESQACGTPVVAAAVGGLTTAVSNGRSGVLVEGHDPSDYAAVLLDLGQRPDRLQQLRSGAVRHAAGFGWERTAAAMLDVYREALTGAATRAQVAS